MDEAGRRSSEEFRPRIVYEADAELELDDGGADFGRKEIFLRRESLTG